MFLTFEQLVELTGAKRASLQVEVLQSMGVPHYVRRDGRPVVVAAALVAQPAAVSRTRPDFDSVRRSG